jgi:hypothetical protein
MVTTYKHMPIGSLKFSTKPLKLLFININAAAAFVSSGIDPMRKTTMQHDHPMLTDI